MSEQSQVNGTLPEAPAEQDMLNLIKKIQQQLIFLEKKIDTLINQSQPRPLSQQHPAKPFRSFGRPHRRSYRAQVDASGEKGLDHRRHFEKRHNAENRGFEHKKKTGDSFRAGDSNQRPHFEKQHDAEKKWFGQKKKPFAYRRKDHR